jgi:hypothetical protein
MNADLTDALAFRSRLHEATRLVQALEGCEARHLAQLRETRGSLRDARKKLDQLIRGDAAPCPLFDRPTPAIAEPVPNVCVADIPAAPTPVPSCRVCGCTEASPCLEECDWIGPDLCSGCKGFEDLGRVVVRQGAAFRLWRRGDVLIGSCLASEFGDWAHQEEHLEDGDVDPHDYWPTGDDVEKAVASVVTDRRVSYSDYSINSASGRLQLVFDLSPLVKAAPMSRGKAIAYELHRALHRVEGAATRWRKLQDSGPVYDAELLEAIGREFGSGGASGDRDSGSPGYRVEGGKRPRFWIGEGGRLASPDLAGKELLSKAREVLGIPAPPKFYAWDVTIGMNNNTPEQTVTVVAPTENQARRKALLRPNAREVVKLEGMTEEQYRRVHGSRRRRV